MQLHAMPVRCNNAPLFYTAIFPSPSTIFLHIPSPAHPTMMTHLQELGHHSNHEIEKTDGFDESETQNGVREELITQAWVTGNGLQERSEDETDTNTGTGKTDSSTSHTEILGSLNEGVSHFGGVWAAGELSLGEDLAGLLTLDGLENSLGVFAHGSEGTLSTKVGSNHWTSNLCGGRSHKGSHLRSNTRGHYVVYEVDSEMKYFWRKA